MVASQSLSELVHAAQAGAKLAQDRVSEILQLNQTQDLSNLQAKTLVTEIVAIEAAAIDIFTVFEKRMQHHFKRGPLSRKLKAAILAAGRPDLASRLHQYYLAINVLKHGTGASYRELRDNKNALFIVKKPADKVENILEETTGLIDVTSPQFFDGLADTILEAADFLEKN